LYHARTAIGIASFALSSTGSAARGQQLQPLFGWGAVIAVPGEYAVGSDVARRLGGAGFTSGTIVSAVEEPTESAYLLQSIRSDQYRGKRVRFTGYVKTILALGQAGLFVRIDGRDSSLAGDFMVGRLIQTSKEWAKYSIVLDVPNDAIGITFGLHLTGAGQAWLDDVSLETVESDVPTTTPSPARPWHGPVAIGPNDGTTLATRYRHAPLVPVNLDFEQTRPFATWNRL
jgi:hypothetical protein